MSSSRRVQRVEKELRQIVAEYLLTRFKDPLPQGISVTRVDVAGDLRSAKVYIRFMNSEDPQEEALVALQKWAPEIQKHISRQLRMKFCPRLQFLKDEFLDNVLRVERLLKDVTSSEGE